MSIISSEDINLDEIYQYALFAKHAYSSHSELKSKFGNNIQICELTKSRVQILLVNDQCKNIQWIAIRGTTNPKNVLSDVRIKIIREPQLGIYFHGGFTRAAHEAYDFILPNLDFNQEIRVTGHSLGGAVALIFSSLLAGKTNKYNLGRTVTFGQPMVTDRNGVKALKDLNLLRIVNKWDPVAILPFLLARTHFELKPTFFYCHAGRQLTLYGNHKLKLSSPSRIPKFVFGYKKLIANHSIDLYLQRLLLKLEEGVSGETH